MQNLKREIGKRIKEVRKEFKLSREKLGKKLGYHRNTILKIEKGEQAPALEFLLSFAKLFRISVTWLITGKGEKYSYHMGLGTGVVEDKKFDIELNKIVITKNKKPELFNIFLKMIDISNKNQRKIKSLVKSGIKYEKALLYLTLESLK